MITLIGIFGNSPFDRSMENQLNRYLDSLEEDDYEPDPDEKYDEERLREHEREEDGKDSK